MGVFDKYTSVIGKMDPIKFTGTITRVQGLLIESRGPHAVVGELCQIVIKDYSRTIWAEVVGLREDMVQLMPYSDMEGIEIGCPVIALGEYLNVPVSDKLLGRVLDAMGRPIDNKGDIGSTEWRSIFQKAPDVLKRQRILEKISTGIRSIDALLTAGKGQRLGIFSGSGVGKSTLISMIARNTSADINVISLVGERGREVREFIENDLGEEGLKRSVVVVATSNEPPLSRIRGAYVSIAIAEYFRDKGLNVMLMFDSITRFAKAQREIGLAIGEPPANRGYTPSVFAALPKLLERSGNSDKGTLTAFFTILVDGDDMDEPIADAVRGILDGHIILSRQLAHKGHFPAVDVLGSISRLASIVTGPKTKMAAAYLRRIMAVYKEAEDLINVGAYVRGSSPDIDEAIKKMDEINAFLVQSVDDKTDIKTAIIRLGEIAGIVIPAEEYEYAAVPV